MTSPIQIWREAKNRYQYLGKIGRILSLTKIQTPLAGFEKSLPYYAAIIELAEGKKITGQLIENSKEPKMGSQVIGVLRRLKNPDEKGIIEYGVKWKIY
jgi:uncharacterized OB-fold protein